MADTFPLDKAVKNPEEIMFNPLNKKLMENNLKPTTAKLYVSTSFVNIPTKIFELKIAASIINIEDSAVNPKEIL